MIVEKAKAYAIKCHRDCNQKYANGLPYEFHLQMAADIAENFIWMIPEADQADVIGGCWVHDIIEDAGQTYNNVLKNTNKVIAEYAYALTNEKGRNRKERANDKYYKGIREYKHATFIKLCDRIANVKFSKENKSDMFEMYQEEMEHFHTQLYDARFDAMWLLLKLMLSDD